MQIRSKRLSSTSCQIMLRIPLTIALFSRGWHEIKQQFCLSIYRIGHCIEQDIVLNRAKRRRKVRTLIQNLANRTDYLIKSVNQSAPLQIPISKPKTEISIIPIKHPNVCQFQDCELKIFITEMALAFNFRDKISVISWQISRRNLEIMMTL